MRVSLARRKVIYGEAQNTGVNSLDLRECEDCGDVVEKHPLFAGLLTIGLGAVVYTVISVVMAGAVDPIEITLFAVIFGVTYTAGNYVYRTNVAA